MEENYLARWLDGTLEGEELIEFQKSPEYESFERIKAATEDLKVDVVYREGDIWEAIRDRHSQRSALPEADLNSKTDSPVRRLYTRTSFLRIAASVALLLGVSYFVFRNGETRLNTGNAEREMAQLPDQSKVTLNAGSSLSFSASQWETKRQVELEGEAFFDVAKGKKFTVRTPLGEIAVLGTQFDVLQRGDFFRVQCFEGKVSVSYLGAEYVLQPGQTFQVVKGEDIWQFQHKHQASEWITDHSDFRSVPLEYVIGELARQYNVKVELNQVPVDKKFTGSFRHDDLRQALEYISKPTKLTYTIEKGIVRLYGASDEPEN